MTRILFHGGELFDGTGEDLARLTSSSTASGSLASERPAPATRISTWILPAGRCFPGCSIATSTSCSRASTFCETCRRPDGTARKRITVGGGAAAWSPDASHIVYEFNLGGRQNYIASDTGRDARPLVTDSDDDCCATWS